MAMFSFVKKVFALGLTVLSRSITGALECLSMNNQECKVRPKMVDVSSNNPVFYSINDPYAKICVPNIVKKLTTNETNETKSIKLHETCNAFVG